MNEETLNRATLLFAGIVLGALLSNLSLPSMNGLNERRSASANIVAVSEDGEGEIGKVNVEIVPGNGKVLVETDPFIETDTQLSAKSARNVAERVTGRSLENSNVLYSFGIRGEYLGGPSAGAAMTLATIAAIENSSVRDDVAVTGTITERGRIGRVGSVMEKSEIAGESGINTFLVPKGQEETFFYRRQVEERSVGGFVFQDVNYVPERVLLDNLTKERYGMETRSVSNVEELLEYGLEGG